MSAELTYDADGRALRMIAQRGVDMQIPMTFEFFIHVEDELNSEKVLTRLKTAGVGKDNEAVYDEGELDEGEEPTEENKDYCPSWTVCVCHDMIPSYDQVVSFQKRLVEICGDLGKPDGWTIEIG